MMYRLTPAIMSDANAEWEPKRTPLPAQTKRRYYLILPAAQAQDGQYKVAVDLVVKHTKHAWLWIAEFVMAKPYISVRFEGIYARTMDEIDREVQTRLMQFVTAVIGATPVLVAGGQ